MYASYPRRAFTLVELSVVLVIVALLVGGTLAGRAMIRDSEMRGLMTDTNNIVTAINTFKSQYGALPGDIPNATSYWSSATNGNGDGAIYYGSVMCTAMPFPSCMIAPPVESPLTWQDLGFAGIVSTSGTTAPTSKMPDAQFSIGYKLASFLAYQPGLQSSYTLDFYNGLTIMNKAGSQGLLTPEEAYSVDTKMDDGLPASGNWVAYSKSGLGAATSCANSTNATDFSAATNSYNLTSSIKDCGFDVYNVF